MNRLRKYLGGGGLGFNNASLNYSSPSSTGWQSPTLNYTGLQTPQLSTAPTVSSSSEAGSKANQALKYTTAAIGALTAGLGAGMQAQAQIDAINKANRMGREQNVATAKYRAANMSPRSGNMYGTYQYGGSVMGYKEDMDTETTERAGQRNITEGITEGVTSAIPVAGPIIAAGTEMVKGIQTAAGKEGRYTLESGKTIDAYSDSTGAAVGNISKMMTPHQYAFDHAENEEYGMAFFNWALPGIGSTVSAIMANADQQTYEDEMARANRGSSINRGGTSGLDGQEYRRGVNMNALQDQMERQIPTARYGGLIKYQNGGPSPWQTPGATYVGKTYRPDTKGNLVPQGVPDPNFIHSTTPGSTRWVTKEGNKTPFQDWLSQPNMQSSLPRSAQDTLIKNDPRVFNVKDYTPENDYRWGAPESRSADASSLAEAFNKTYGDLSSLKPGNTPDRYDQMYLQYLESKRSQRGTREFDMENGQGTDAYARFKSKATYQRGGEFPQPSYAAQYDSIPYVGTQKGPQLYNDPFADKQKYPVPSNVEFDRRDTLLGLRDRNLPLPINAENELGPEFDRNFKGFGRQPAFVDPNKMEKYKTGGMSYSEGVKRSDANAELENNEIVMKKGGSKDVKVNGPSHEQGGVPMKLEKGDYVWSDHLKDPQSGMSMAQLYEKLSKNGASDSEINQLMQYQEALAGRAGGQGMDQIAKNGGLMKYQNGTPSLSPFIQNPNMTPGQMDAYVKLMNRNRTAQPPAPPAPKKQKTPAPLPTPPAPPVAPLTPYVSTVGGSTLNHKGVPVNLPAVPMSTHPQGGGGYSRGAGASGKALGSNPTVKGTLPPAIVEDKPDYLKYAPEMISGLGSLAGIIATATQDFDKVPVPQAARVKAEKMFLDRISPDAEIARSQQDFRAMLDATLRGGQGPGASSTAQEAYSAKVRADEQARANADRLNIQVDATEKAGNIDSRLKADMFNEENAARYREMAFAQDAASKTFERERTQAIVNQILQGTQAVADTAMNRRYAEAVSGDTGALERFKRTGLQADLDKFLASLNKK